MEQQKFGVYDLFMLVLCIYVMIALLVETFFKLPQDIQEIFFAIDFGICIVFLLDFFFNLLTKGVKYLKWGWIDFVSSIPMIGPLRAGEPSGWFVY